SRRKWMSMADVYDVAAYILAHEDEMSAMKLQKLVFYCQARHLVWDDAQLFPERIEAWANGPVCPDLYRMHHGAFSVSKLSWGQASNLTDSERTSIDVVLKTYGTKSGAWLSELTHMEHPWLDARGDLSPCERGSAEITTASMV